MMANYVAIKSKIGPRGVHVTNWDDPYLETHWMVVDLDEVDDEVANRGVKILGISTREEAEEWIAQRRREEAAPC